MDPISNADRIVGLLRQKLMEREQARKSGRARTEAADRTPQGLDLIRAIVSKSAQGGVDDRALRRILVEHLLFERFDASLANEPRFQQIVGQVSDRMAEDPELLAMLDEVLRDMSHITS